MLKKVILAENSLNPLKWKAVKVENMLEFLTSKFDKFPDTGKIYHNQVSKSNDVTPSDEASVKKLASLEGTFYVIIYPGEAATIALAVISVLLSITAVVLAFTNAPNVSQRKIRSSSPNNGLSDRENQARPLGRIPDIYGTVRAVPDLLTSPYRVFVGNNDLEYSYMCLGRGEYDIEANNVKEDDTRLSTIENAAVSIYGPNTSPNSGSPQLEIGNSITEDLYYSKRLEAVNGQILRPPNDAIIIGDNNIKFRGDNELRLLSFDEIEFSDFFKVGELLWIQNGQVSGTLVGAGANNTILAKCTASYTIVLATPSNDYNAGDTLELQNAVFNYSGGSLNLNGTYVIESATSTLITLSEPFKINLNWDLITNHFPSGETGQTNIDLIVPSGLVNLDLSGLYEISIVTQAQIILDNPSSLNADWNTLLRFGALGETGYISPTIYTDQPKLVGPFILTNPNLEEVFSNFVALNGLYKIKKSDNKQSALSVEVSIRVTPVDENDQSIGTPEIFSIILKGSSVLKTTVGSTIKANLTLKGRQSIEAWRTTNKDFAFDGNIVDDVKWRDCYAMEKIALSNFGNVTTVHSLSYATEGALALKSRRLNITCTRKIPQRISGENFTSTFHATNRADEILAAIALDPYIGNRQVSELDLDNIYNTVAEIETYFGTDKAIEFQYTFDNDNLSFEETVSMIAQAIHCVIYRQGSQIKLSFEKETDISTLLFNHRNKLPGSEKRSVRFGNQSDNDGVEFQYINPEDESIATYYIPVDRSAINPKRVESVGIRSQEQAYFHAWRIWNKIKYHNVTSEFEATQEAHLLVINDKILLADNTRSDTQDGEVISQAGLILTLSQDVIFEQGETYSIFLQHIDNTVEVIAITAGVEANEVVLNNAPKQALNLDPEAYSRATYQMIKDSSVREKSFLVVEKEPQNNFTLQLKAINYDANYYQNDKDIINGTEKTVIIETGSQPDQIIETGSQTNVYKEGV